MSDEAKLGSYKGHEIVGAAMKLTNAGDGLSKAMSLTPVDLDFGQRVHVVIEAVVTEHGLKPAIAGDLYGPLRVVSTLKAEAATIVENATVAKILDKHKAALNRAKEIEGQRSIEDETPAADDDNGE
jgi:hypothetical protein